jgi:hypothetical protein
MLRWPDWNKLYAKWQCLYFGVPFSDAQWDELNNAKSEDKKNELIRKWREEYLKNRDVITGKLKEEVKVEKPTPAPVEEEAPVEEPVEDEKTTKAKKGK